MINDATHAIHINIAGPTVCLLTNELYAKIAIS